MDNIINTLSQAIAQALAQAMQQAIESEVAKALALQTSAAVYVTEPQVRQMINDLSASVDEDRTREIAREEAEEVMDNHTSDYNHDDFATDIDDAVSSALNGMTVTLRV